MKTDGRVNRIFTLGRNANTPYPEQTGTRIDAPSTRSPSHNFDDFFPALAETVFAMLYKASKMAANGLANIFDCFVPGMSLRNTTWQRRAFRYEHSVLLRFNNHSEVHNAI